MRVMVDTNVIMLLKDVSQQNTGAGQIVCNAKPSPAS